MRAAARADWMRPRLRERACQGSSAHVSSCQLTRRRARGWKGWRHARGKLVAGGTLVADGWVGGCVCNGCGVCVMGERASLAWG
eukprot:scaffold99569_cov36-Phaeocystis_antarctica.AAC.1